jgi:4'-phosphopantetheinyl transferase
MSRSNGYALFAFDHDREIGVDIERIYDFAGMGNVAEKFFSTKEKAVLRLLSKAEKGSLFIFWTRKEAYIKAIGEGFSSDLGTIDISSYTIGESVSVHTGENSENKKHWTVQDLPLFLLSREMGRCITAGEFQNHLSNPSIKMAKILKKLQLGEL